ncbi:MAG: indolepyruvate oxidoreductase subunit beta [Gaiellales bacterium]|nr:indolepyruvate oxidoreductase subunit beta [Gaiellales bacterium]
MDTAYQEPMNLLLSGVGGQGVILASFLLSQVALEAGYDIKQSEVHGMAQRGGSVVSHLRFGHKVYAPLFTPGQADLLLSFEPLEALRYLHWLKKDGLLVYNTVRVNPSTVSSGAAEYPEGVEERIGRSFGRVVGLNAVAIAAQAGTARAANLVLLGAASPSLPFSREMWDAVLKRELASNVLEVNLKAFQLGRAAVEG